MIFPCSLGLFNVDSQASLLSINLDDLLPSRRDAEKKIKTQNFYRYFRGLIRVVHRRRGHSKMSSLFFFVNYTQTSILGPYWYFTTVISLKFQTFSKHSHSSPISLQHTSWGLFKTLEAGESKFAKGWKNMACTQFSDGNVYFLFGEKYFSILPRLTSRAGKSFYGGGEVKQTGLLCFSDGKKDEIPFNVFKCTFHSIVLLFHMRNKRSPP